MSENYYVLLKLDPSVDDWAIIEAAILQRRRDWGLHKNQGTPAQRRSAERTLALIPDMEMRLKDPAQRRAIAQEAVKELQAGQAKQLEELDGLIKVLTQNEVEPEMVQTLAKQSGVSEANVTARLLARGIAVVAGRPAAARPRPKLDPTAARDIRNLLDKINCKDLYALLGLSPRSSPKSLYDAALEMEKELGRKGMTDADTSARRNLCGRCMALFQTADSKERYDNSIEIEAMQGLDKKLLIVGADHVIDATELNLLVEAARQLGVKADVAQAYIEEFARDKGWKVQKVQVVAAANLRCCGFCGALARDPKADRCTACGQLLIQPCPRCQHPTPTEEQACGQCGCGTGDAPLVQGLLREGKEFAASGDFVKALACLDRALIYWDGWAPALEEKRRIERVRRNHAEAVATIHGLVQARKLEAAQGALDRLVVEYGRAGTEIPQQAVREGMRRAADAFGAAEALRRSGKTEDAVGRYSEALSHCADFKAAQAAMEACPPPAPTGLAASLAGATARLIWQPVRAQGSLSYCVVRKAQGSPTSLADGERVAEVTGTQCDNPNLLSGTPWFYSVYTVRAGVASAAAATCGPVLVVADVDSVIAEAGNGQVALRWRRPLGATAVEILRGAALVPVSGDSALDTGLVNGQRVSYQLVALFANPQDPHNPLRAPGVTVHAQPVAPPQPVVDLAARRTDRTVVLTWTQPVGADVQIRQMRQMPAHQSGRIVALSEADRFGSLVRITGRGATQIQLEGQGRITFVPLSVIAETAVVGKAVTVTTLDDVAHLAARRQGMSMELTWEWPAGAAEVAIAWGHAGFVASPTEPADGRVRVTRAEYDRLGLWQLRNAPPVRHYFTVCVRDVEADACSPGVQVLEASGTEVQVDYRVVCKRGFLGFSARENWVRLSCRDAVELPAIVAVLKPAMPPLRPEDGRAIASAERVAFQAGVARLDLPADCGKGFIKLFFQDGRHAREFRLLPAAADDLKVV